MDVFLLLASGLLKKYPRRLRSEYTLIANITGGIRGGNPLTSTSEVQLCGLMGLPSAPNGKLKSYCVVGRLEGEMRVHSRTLLDRTRQERDCLGEYDNSGFVLLDACMCVYQNYLENHTLLWLCTLELRRTTWWQEGKKIDLEGVPSCRSKHRGCSNNINDEDCSEDEDD